MNIKLDNEKVYIEHCKACSSHQWCTNHDESKYLSYFENIKAKIQVTCPEVQVISNQVPLFISNKFTENVLKEGKKKNFPRIGAFEIYFRDKVIFSKLETGVWPQSALISNKIREVLDFSKQPSKIREVNTSNLLKKRKKIKPKPRNSQSTEPNLSRKPTKRDKNITPFNRKIEKSLRDNQNLPKNNEFKNTEKNDDEYSDDFKDESKDFENDCYESERKITKTYQLSLSAEKLSNKKINFQNKSENDCEFDLKSSDPVNMIVKENFVKIPAGQSGKFQLRFPPLKCDHQKVYFLNVDNNGKPWECLKFIVDYK